MTVLRKNVCDNTIENHAAQSERTKCTFMSRLRSLLTISSKIIRRNLGSFLKIAELQRPFNILQIFIKKSGYY